MTVQEQQQIRIRELEKEIARLHAQIKEQRYGLTWLDVPEAFEADSENKIPILEEVEEKAIDVPCRDAARHVSTEPHIIIEGDNYHALTCLNYTHRGKIDVIYIDPPYNTGSDGFTYKDKRILKEFPDGSPVPKEHPLRHSYWLSFMSKRLELAKNLLSDNGVIFISIDDNEQANLKLLCDKVFGEENYLNTIIWNKNSTTVMLNKEGFSSNTEYVMLYKKGKSIQLQNNPISDKLAKSYNKDDNDGRGRYGSVHLYTNTNNNKLVALKMPDGSYFEAKWQVTQETFDQYVKDGLVFKTPTGWRKKIYLSNCKGSVPVTLLEQDTVGTTKTGTSELQNIFETTPFAYPKPTTLIKYLIDRYPIKNATILDFFAGSGTTLHATMKLNAEDGGNRQCILVQQREGENNICENVTYERNRRVMCGYTNAKGEQVEGLGGRLKYYRTAFVGKNASRTATDADRVELSLKAGYLLALGENTLEGICHTESYQIFADGENPQKYTAIFFTENYAKLPDFVAEIEQLRANAATPVEFAVYIFCWGQPDVFEGEFNSLRGISLKAIPQPILDVYKSINQ